ncbi:creatininase family protein [Planococcus shixiaomingii]|uniref:creatininase family protein n=1 Tax=Planococcus shixiaomingii TaxID=3058393 RepID=UPI0026311FA1|nr:creatininase family protein [Planococcus sp. N022]WKA56792.1 creatininase family protein [Planococcus sp. N022]
MWLQENKWRDVEEYLKTKKTIIVPFGSVEQHAHHLPLGTDSFVAQKVAEDAGRLTDTLVAPPVWTGWAPHHMAYPGTITLRPETLTAVAEDTLQSLIYHGFEKILIVNGHREANLPPLRIAMTRLRNKTGAFIAIVDPFYFNAEAGKTLRKSAPGGIGHAEELESSHMLHLFPELCNPSKTETNIPKKHPFLQHDPYVEGDRVLTASDVAGYREVTEGTGLMGDAAPSDAATGEAYHKAFLDNFTELIRYCEEDVKVALRKPNLPL